MSLRNNIVVLFLFCIMVGYSCSDVLGPGTEESPPADAIQGEPARPDESITSVDEQDKVDASEPTAETPRDEMVIPEKAVEVSPEVVDEPAPPQNDLFSPNKQLRFELSSKDRELSYRILKGTRVILDWSRLGIALDGTADLSGKFVIESVARKTVNQTWKPVWGQHSSILDNHNEAIFTLREVVGEKRVLEVIVRAFNDGFGFRYRIPGKSAGQTVRVTDELTTFRFAEKGTAWSIPLSFDTHERLYTRSSIENVKDANTPVTFKYNDGLHLALHEADLENYAGYSLTRVNDALKVTLPPADKANATIKVTGVTPFETPWRVLLITDKPGGLIESTTILNLNDPCAICNTNTGWIKPRKYVGIWWEIHKGISLWKDGPNVGATTKNAKRYIDFASRAGIPGFLAEGWNVGWGGGTMDFLKANTQFDLAEVVRYGLSKNPPVYFIAHMETNADVAGLERQIDKAFTYYQSLKIDAIKTGYVGDIPKYYHASQGMVKHYQDVLKKAAAKQIMVNVHEPIKPTGMRRKYPNLLSGEGARGMEYNAWSAGNPPSHTLTLPFTRILGGPMDYTPGIFYIKWSPKRLSDSVFNNAPVGVVHTTRARQLALYVLIFSGVQMVTDLPEHYNSGPGQGLAPEFAFIREVPTTWDETRVLTSSIGEHLVMVRRSGNRWFLGAGTDKTPRKLKVSLSFLGSGSYTAKIFADGSGADVDTNPEPVSVTERTVTSTDSLEISMVGSGGQAIIFTPKP